MKYAIILFFILSACSLPKEKIPPVAAMEKTSGKIVIYQLLPRLFGNKKNINTPYGTLAENTGVI